MKHVALALASRGIDILPSLKKRPLLQFEEATHSLDRVEEIWDKNPKAIPAIHLGASKLLAIDIDNKNEVDGFKSLQKSKIHDLPKTLMYPTPNNGYHIIYSTPDDKEYTAKLSAWKGVDLKGGVGIVVFYGDEKIATNEIAPAPSWLVERLVYRKPVHLNKGTQYYARIGRLQQLGHFKPTGMSHNDLLHGCLALAYQRANETPEQSTHAMNIAKSVYATDWGSRAFRDFEDAYNWAVSKVGEE